MDEIEELRGATRIVEHWCAVRPGETVVVVADWRTTGVARRLAAAARGRDAPVSMVVSDPRAHNGNEPPATVAAAVTEADVVFEVLSQTMPHTRAARRAREAGARWATMGMFTPAQLADGPIHDDPEGTVAAVAEMADRFTAADSARVTSPQGTDVTFGLGGPDGNALDGYVTEPGGIGAPGFLEANISPETGTAEGTIVADGAIPDLGVGALDDEVELAVERGQVVDVAGGREARVIERAWAGYEDPAVYNVAQLAVGMTPSVHEFGDEFLPNHGRFGNVHVGIGDSESFLAGTEYAPVHFDVMLAEATLELDGEVVLRDGREFTFL